MVDVSDVENNRNNAHPERIRSAGSFSAVTTFSGSQL